VLANLAADENFPFANSPKDRFSAAKLRLLLHGVRIEAVVPCQGTEKAEWIGIFVIIYSDT
jgi:hypothetical protein